MARSKFIFVYITCPKKAVAEKIAKEAVQRKLAACANILPNMQSVYRWQGRVVLDKEIVLILKTRNSLFKGLESLVKRMHPYECPCIVALSVTKGSREYLGWLEAQVFDQS